MRSISSFTRSMSYECLSLELGNVKQRQLLEYLPALLGDDRERNLTLFHFLKIFPSREPHIFCCFFPTILVAGSEKKLPNLNGIQDTFETTGNGFNIHDRPMT